MGDRGNIVVRQGETNREDVWFYTHWRGYCIGKILASALSQKVRWNDPVYLARIIFCELVKGDEAGEIGFGISTRIADNEHRILVVDVPNEQVWAIEERELDDGRIPDNFKPSKTVAFDKFKANSFPEGDEEDEE